MNKRTKYSVLTVILAVVCACSVFFGMTMNQKTDASTTSDLEAARKKLSSIQSQQSSLEKQLAAAKASKATQIKAKEVLESQITNLNDEISALNSVIDGINKDIKQKNEELDLLNSQYDTDLENFRKRARASYEAGDTSTLEVLLSSSSLSEMFTKLDLVSVVAEYDRAVIVKLQTQMTRTEEIKKDIESELSEQKNAMNKLASSKASLKAKESQLTSTISTLSSQESSLAQEQEKYSQLEISLDKQIAALAAQQDKEKGNTASRVDGELLWPLSGYSNISSYFGWRTLYGAKNFHTGIDIPAPSGTPIKAAGDGTVIQSGWVTTGGGNMVTVNHGGGLITKYCHMSSIAVSVGQSVKQGQVIGYVGTTGNSTGNHLHFGMMYNGEYLNPALYVNPSNSTPSKSIKSLH